MYIDWYFKMLISFQKGQPQKLVTGMACNHLKVMMNLSQNSKQQESLIKTTTETDRQD